MPADKTIHYYLIPGMGADSRLYERYQLKYGVMHKLDWWPHQNARSLKEYAELLANTITTDNNIIIGSSMGGMVASELSHLIKPLATILLSAPASRKEFPRSLNVLENLRIHKILGPKQMMSISKLADLFMGFSVNEQRALFYEMLKGNGPQFLHFSVNAVLGWHRYEEPAGPYLQVLGNRDKLFTEKKIVGAYMIDGSGHFTTYEKADIICDIITKYVEEKILPRL